MIKNPATVGELIARSLEKDAMVQKKRKISEKSTKSRHVTWEPGTTYRCIREGSRAFPSDRVLGELLLPEHRSSTLHERLFYIFHNTDPNAERNPDVPLYEACYRCDGRFVKVQKCHLKLAYANASRGDYTQMWSLDEHGVPYWVDRHAFSKFRQREHKRRYENKKSNV